MYKRPGLRIVLSVSERSRVRFSGRNLEISGRIACRDDSMATSTWNIKISDKVHKVHAALPSYAVTLKQASAASNALGYLIHPPTHA